ncbi:Trm112 family protein [Dolichospermum circinale]|uniref:Trm112 family protein n=1 Tax=Dolichospermum circinale TaxID=109265 RepID=UPI002330CCF2|nr:hypothetical protein [Dolichospermum circinale]MDB9456404.1 hypothetical protein [Dolichospermum circinale CS-541/06]MDB9463001.1 hypothetical protein [Dolichospermum circinale CS-541/04]MDB9549176.1 hypothetical protein [Dolichospermum circinale CS-1031]
MKIIDDWYLENLVCPQDKTALNLVDNNLVSQSGNSYSIVNGIPIMLLNNVKQTIELANNSLTDSKVINDSDPYFIDGFFGLGIQKSDIDLLPLKYKLVVRASESLKILSLLIPFLKYVADSVYIKSTKSI